MIAVLLAAILGAGCAGAPPAGLVDELSVIHEVTPLPELRARYPALVDHLAAIATDPAASPIARDRAWTLLAASPEARAGRWAAAALDDPAVPASTRAKIRRRLQEHHPERVAPR